MMGELVCLEEMKGLIHLNLSQTKISDNAITSIGKLKQFKQLLLKGTRITSEGVEQLH